MFLTSVHHHFPICFSLPILRSEERIVCWTGSLFQLWTLKNSWHLIVIFLIFCLILTFWLQHVYKICTSHSSECVTLSHFVLWRWNLIQFSADNAPRSVPKVSLILSSKTQSQQWQRWQQLIPTLRALPCFLLPFVNACFNILDILFVSSLSTVLKCSLALCGCLSSSHMSVF